jgi:hypothetical protein
MLSAVARQVAVELEATICLRFCGMAPKPTV